MVKTSKMALTIAVSNQKGGAGKTTVAINTAGALSNAGLDVLLLDFDPQGHSSEALGFGDLYDSDADLTLADVVLDINANDRLGELVVEHPEFDVVPAHFRMFNVESELPTARRKEERLAMALEAVEDDYDVILIDCPPNLGVLTDNALLAAGNIVIPAQARTSSIRAIDLLLDQIETLEDTYGITVRTLAVVANEVRNDNESREMLGWFEDVVGEENVYSVPTRVALQRAWNNEVSIFEHSEDTDDVEETFTALATRIEEACDA